MWYSLEPPDPTPGVKAGGGPRGSGCGSMEIAVALGGRRILSIHMCTCLAPPRMETLLPILQQVGGAVWGSDLGGHHVPAYLVGGSHCHRSRSLPPALCDLQEARCVVADPWGPTPCLCSHAAMQHSPPPHPSWSLALASPLSGTQASPYLSLPELAAQRNCPLRGSLILSDS